jgi:CMP-N-acetylneuraminic acid synthetase
MSKRVGVFLPGRLSSQRLPNKLILPIGDTCLFQIACSKLNDLPSFINKYVLIAQEDEELLKIALKFNNIKIIFRSTSSAEREGPLTYIFEAMKSVEDTHLMFLNPCLLFLKKETIVRAIMEFESSSKSCATSVKVFQNWLFNKDGSPITPIDYERLTTKEITPLYQAAHCFHIFDRVEFFKRGNMLNEHLLPIVISEEETIDVDTLSDYEYAKWRWEQC